MHGLAGSGKSSALAWVEGHLWQRCDLQREGAVVPIFISLPMLREPASAAVQETLQARGFSRRNIEELFGMSTGNRFVVLFDAVDELKEKYALAIF